MLARPLPLALALASIAGCCGMCAETTKSENVRTEGMRADVTVRARGEAKAEVDVRLRVGGALSNVFPELSAGDRLEAVSGAETVPLVFDKGIIATPGYHGKLAGDLSGRPVEIRYLRTGNTSAVGTRVVMPPGFSFTAPPSGAKLSAASPVLSLAWSPPAGVPLSWSVDGRCIVGQRGDLATDTGRLEVTLAAAPPPEGGPAPSTCDVTVKLERTARGILDPAFGEGGDVRAVQQRELTVVFTP